MPLNRYKALAVLLMIVLSAKAQDEIATDRPDQTETAQIVPTGRFQAESGFEHNQTGTNSKEFSLPETLLKVGFNDKVELRIIAPLSYNVYNDSTTSGLSPITVGFKANLFTEKGMVPETSVIVHLMLPKVASRELQSTLLAPEILMLFENELSKNVELGYNIGIKWDGQSPQPVYVYTLSPNFTLTDKLKAFAETFGFLPENQHAEHWVDGGFMFLITKNVQVDLAAGYELTSHQHFHQYYETLGISFRI